jgi:hypothetical protein
MGATGSNGRSLAITRIWSGCGGGGASGGSGWPGTDICVDLEVQGHLSWWRQGWVGGGWFCLCFAPGVYVCIKWVVRGVMQEVVVAWRQVIPGGTRTGGRRHRRALHQHQLVERKFTDRSIRSRLDRNGSNGGNAVSVNGGGGGGSVVV